MGETLLSVVIMTKRGDILSNRGARSKESVGCPWAERKSHDCG